jgi:hypothetical protein
LHDRGISRAALTELLDGHLVDMDVFVAQNFPRFLESRTNRWIGFMQRELASPV